MKKLFSPSCFLGLFVIILLFSCSTEDNLTPSSQTQSINNAKTWFESNSDAKNLKILKYTKDIQWENAVVSNGDKGQIVEVPLTLMDNISTTNSKTKPLKDYHRLLFLKDENDNFKSYHIQIFTDDITYNNLDKNFNFYNINDGFNGLVTVFDADSQSANLLKFRNGQKTKPNSSSRMGEDEITCTYLGYWHEDGTFEPIALLYCVGGGDSEGTGAGGGGEYGAGPQGGGGSTTTTDEEIIDELTGKAKCIYEKLKNTSTGFENAIKKFDGEFPVSHLKLTINNNLSSNVYGETQPPVNYVTEIQFNDESFGFLSDLGKATVFAHEIIHAEIFRKMLSAAQLGNLDPSNMTVQQQTNYVNSLKNNFPGLYDYYAGRYKPTWNHEMMANHYRNTIADMIQEFDNNRLPRSTYEAVAWLGLGKLDTNLTTIAWDNLSAEQKTTINILIKENFYNGPSNCN